MRKMNWEEGKYRKKKKRDGGNAVRKEKAVKKQRGRTSQERKDKEKAMNKTIFFSFYLDRVFKIFI